MECTRCKYPETRVVETNPDDRKNLILRRRECLKCGSRFNTQESLRDSYKRGPYKTQSPNHILPK